MIRSWFNWAVALMLSLTGLYSFFVFGPLAEARFWPVADTNMVSVRVDDKLLHFRLAGNKLRDCPLNAIHFYWRYADEVGHSPSRAILEAAPVFRETVREIWVPPQFVTTGSFRTEELYSVIPPAAYGLPRITFGGRVLNDCHGLWDVVREFEVRLLIDADGAGSPIAMVL